MCSVWRGSRFGCAGIKHREGVATSQGKTSRSVGVISTVFERSCRKMKWVRDSLNGKLLFLLLVVCVFSSATICNAGAVVSHVVDMSQQAFHTSRQVVGRGLQVMANPRASIDNAIDTTRQAIANPRASVNSFIGGLYNHVWGGNVKWTERDFDPNDVPTNPVLSEIGTAILGALAVIDRSANLGYEVPKYWWDSPSNSTGLEYEIEVEISTAKPLSGENIYNKAMELQRLMQPKYEAQGLRKAYLSAESDSVILSYEVKKVPAVRWTHDFQAQTPENVHWEIPAAISAALERRVRGVSRLMNEVPEFTYSPVNQTFSVQAYEIEVEMRLKVRPLCGKYIYGRCNRILHLMRQRYEEEGGFFQPSSVSGETDTVMLSYKIQAIGKRLVFDGERFGLRPDVKVDVHFKPTVSKLGG